MNRWHVLTLALCFLSATVIGALILYGFAWLTAGASVKR